LVFLFFFLFFFIEIHANNTTERFLTTTFQSREPTVQYPLMLYKLSTHAACACG
jgi:hypothetical protein